MLEKKFILRIGKNVLIREMEVERHRYWLGYWQGPDPRCKGVTLRFKDPEVFDTREAAETAARDRLVERLEKLKKHLEACERLLKQRPLEKPWRKRCAECGEAIGDGPFRNSRDAGNTRYTFHVKCWTAFRKWMRMA